VPAADEVHSLRTGTSEEARLFQSVVAQATNHPGHQGVFIVAPSGRLLQSGVGYSPDAIGPILERGLAVWKNLSRGQQGVDSAAVRLPEVSDRAELQYPKDGLVLRLVSRDLPTEAVPLRSDRYHQSFVWFNKSEVKGLLPEEMSEGSSISWPRPLAERIVRFCLLDRGRVDGFTPAFSRKSVLQAEFTTRVKSMRGDSVQLEFTGATETDVADAAPFYRGFPKPTAALGRRGVRTRVLGRGIYDLTNARFIDMQMVAVGVRWGGAYVGRPAEDWIEAPIGFSFSLGDASPAQRVAPDFFDQYGW
jgi:hypothetical protein